MHIMQHLIISGTGFMKATKAIPKDVFDVIAFNGLASELTRMIK